MFTPSFRLFSQLMPICVAAILVAPLSALEVGKKAAQVISVDEVTNAQITLSPDGKTLLADIQGMIYSIPSGGGKAKRLTGPLQETSHPDWSQRGDVIALQSYAGGTFHIWTMRPDGSGLKQITFGHGDDREPRISPDGKTIVFASDRAFKTAENGASMGSYDLWSVPIEGGSPKQLTQSDEDEFGPSWSADGNSIVFVAGTGTIATQIKSLDLQTGKTSVLQKASQGSRFEAPTWSPDGKHLSYVEYVATDVRSLNSGVMKVTDADGSGTPVSLQSTDTFPFPAIWSGDEGLYYTGNGHILHADLRNHTEAVVPFHADIPYQPHGFVHRVRNFDSAAKRPVKGIYAPVISPDGTQIAFVALNQLYVMPIGGEPRALTHDTFYKQGPVWSPDGKNLAYVTDRDGIENVYIHAMTDSTDANDKRVAPQGTAQIMPAWSPDGKWIAFQDQTGATLLTEVGSGKVK
ncbi:MAG: hypothetical protein V4734_10260, partial [Terriglobus sp.]